MLSSSCTLFKSCCIGILKGLGRDGVYGPAGVLVDGIQVVLRHWAELRQVLGDILLPLLVPLHSLPCPVVAGYIAVVGYVDVVWDITVVSDRGLLCVVGAVFVVVRPA